MKRSIVAFGASMVLIVALLTGANLWRDHSRALDEATRRTNGVAQMLAEHTAQTVQAIDLTLAQIADAITRDGARAPFDPEIQSLMQREIIEAPQMRAILVTDAAGNLVQNSIGQPTQPIRLADRRYFVAQRDNSAAGLFIDRPVQSRLNGKWFIGMSRRLSEPDGSFAGTVVAIVEPNYFRDLYRSVQSDHFGKSAGNGFIGLFRADGSPLVLSPDILFRDDAVHGVPDAGVRWSLAPPDESAIVSRRAVSGWPLTVTVEQSRELALSRWKTDLVEGIALCAVIAAAVSLLTYLLANQLVRRERSDAALRESKQRLELALSGTSDGVWDWSIPSRTVWCSPRFRELLGYADEECTVDLMAFEGLVHPEDREQTRAEFRRHWRERTPFETECRLRRRDGTYNWYSIRGQSFWDAAGKPMRMAGSLCDVNERRQAETWLMSALGDLRESEATLRTLIANIPGACYRRARDADWTMQFISDAIGDISGYPADELLLNRVRSFASLIHPDDRAAVTRMVAEALEGRRSFDLEYRLLHRVGSVRWVHEKGQGCFGEDGTLLYLDGAIFDITKRKRSEEELRAAKEAAEAGNSAKSDFLATMSHEIRTPMNGILGMTGLLLDSALDAEQRLYARSIHQSAEALLTVINDILDFSKLEASKLTLESIDFDIAAIVASVTELCEPRARAKGLDLGVFIAPGSPRWVRGDPGRLRQILLNLVSNAIKFTEEGGVAIEVSSPGAQVGTHTGEQDDGVILHFKVIDSGIGISAEHRDHLFEKFTQADSSTTRRFGGTGLGLAISKQLAERMGGGIGVDSEPGKGSSFWFTVQVAVADDRTVTADPPVAALQGLRALIVDDNAVNRLIFQRQLESWGMSVEPTDGGAAALDALEAGERLGQPFDIALIDRSMPGMGGEELARRIRENAAFAATRLVLVTSFGELLDEATPPPVFAARLCKPVSQSQLLACLRSLVGASEAISLESQQDTAAPLPDLKAFGGRPLRLLLAEDNQVNQLLAIATLQKAGHRVDVAGNGIEAVEAVLSRPYDMVLMDIQMPEMDGIQATRRIRALPGAKGRIPIIAITANAMRGDRERLLQAGMNDYVAKPIDRKQLFEILLRWSGTATAPGSGLADATPLPEPGAEASSDPAPADPDTEAALTGMLDSLETLRPTGSDGGR
ncbi:PAS domain-containing protein [Rhodospirillaceae bacterium SYSU D60014]|uniref:PAS domain-containing protein n=1 Tax=Virgifigura deserti TaxID=2268457 RepID=UPI000E661727